MHERPLRILTVSTYDIYGGAAKAAWDLFDRFRQRGHRSFLAVGAKSSEDPGVVLIPNSEEQEKGRWYDFWHNRVLPQAAIMKRRNVPGAWRTPNFLWWLAQPGRWWDRMHGIEDFRCPGTKRLLELTSERPDIVHCHNLHGCYFDLRVLPWLSQQTRVVLTLHDAWLMTGLCSHSFECDRWKTGCGQCPLLHIYIDPELQPPPDATAYNWRRKRRIYKKSRLYVAAPCRWLMEKVEQSILTAALVESQIIPYGVDLSVFQPGDKQAVRALLGIPTDARVILFIAQGLRANPAKDYDTIKAAFHLLGQRRTGQRILFVARGESGSRETVGPVEIQYVPFEKDFGEVVRYYQAADLYLHSAAIDTFPLVVLEALACGLPVLATAVGGIPEQIKSLGPLGPVRNWKEFGEDEATGVLLPPKDPVAMASAVEKLLIHDHLRARLGRNAAQDARTRFSLETQVDRYLSWYAKMLANAALN
jgi:glycosyltransferase involved in cell wall biosynthesis